MDKEATLEQLRNAKKAHISWVQRANALIEGLPVEQQQVPVNCTECKFGIWFYGEGQHLNTIPGMEILKEIEQYHFELHEVYLKIFSIYFKDSERSFLSKLFGVKRKIPLEEQEKAQDYFRKLKEISEKLLSSIERLERRVNALAGSYFTK